MLIWYFILTILLLMFIIQFIAKKRKKPFKGLKGFLPSFSQEAGQELFPTKQTVENYLPFFPTSLDLVELTPQSLRAEWNIGEKTRNKLSNQLGAEVWHNCQGTLRIHHTNAVPQPYFIDIKADLAKGLHDIKINAPGETINCELGIITETGAFIPLARSNDIIIPWNP